MLLALGAAAVAFGVAVLAGRLVIVAAAEEAQRKGACLAIETAQMYGALDEKTRRLVLKALTEPGLQPANAAFGNHRALVKTCAGLRSANAETH